MLHLLVKEKVLQILQNQKQSYIFNADKINDYERGVIDGISECIRIITFSDMSK